MHTDSEAKDDKPQPTRRGIYLLPNLFTTAAMFSGFYAIISSINGRFEAAAMAIFIAMLLDTMDGRIARLTNTQTNFGAEYDSLADLVSFGVAPALVMYLWSLSDLGRLGWAAAFAYTVFAALRLARFNTQVATADKAFFQGLPSPAAAALIAGSVWVCHSYEIPGETVQYFAFVLTILAGMLMFSNIRYRSFKDSIKQRLPFMRVLVLVLVFILAIMYTAQVLFTLFTVYAISGPVLTLRQIRDRRLQRRNQRHENHH